MKSIAAVIEWYGPYGLDEAKEVASNDFGDGLYMAIGKCKYQRATQLQYVGLSSHLASRLYSDRHKLSRITREVSIWIGDVTTPRSPGRKVKVTDRMLDLAEWVHIFFLQLPLNDKKRVTPPEYPVTVYNRWWKKDYETQYRQRPHRVWPDLVDFLGHEYPARTVWFGGRQIIWKPKSD